MCSFSPTQLAVCVCVCVSVKRGKGKFKGPHYLLSSGRAGNISALVDAVSSAPATYLVPSKHSIKFG